MTEETPGGGPEAQPVRRRLQSAGDADTKGRNGCLVTGAILGIIFGLTFAFYGLPPILRHYYGEEKVATGEAFVDGQRSISVASIAAQSPGFGEDLEAFIIEVRTTGFPVDEPRAGRFRLEIEGMEGWLAPAAGSGPPTGDFGLAEGERAIILRFVVPSTNPAVAKPVALHLEDPRVKFDLVP